MFTARSKPDKNMVNNEVFKTLTARRADKTFYNDWVIDGLATINLSNGVGYIEGTKKSKETVFEVVGRTKILCNEVADYSIPIYVRAQQKANIVLKEVPITYLEIQFDIREVLHLFRVLSHQDRPELLGPQQGEFSPMRCLPRPKPST